MRMMRHPLLVIAPNNVNVSTTIDVFNQTFLLRRGDALIIVGIETWSYFGYIMYVIHNGHVIRTYWARVTSSELLGIDAEFLWSSHSSRG